MTTSNSPRNFIGYAIAVAVFILLCVIYFRPVLDNKGLQQGDNHHATGMAQEITEYKDQTGNHALWTNSAFGGMPTYQIKGSTSYNIFSYLKWFFRLWLPYFTMGILFVYLIGFYVLLVSLKVDKWLSIAGAIAFAFASYNFMIIMAGHITKAYAIGWMPITVAGVILTYRKKYFVGAILTIIGMGLEVAANHVQITFYLMLTVIILVIVKFIYAIKEKEIRAFFIASAILLGAATIGTLPSIRTLWMTYEYGKSTIRGGTILTPPEGNEESTGLRKDYALGWSYGKAETFTMLIPNFSGGGNERLTTESETYKSLVENGIPAQSATQFVMAFPLYWGKLPFTAGPVYVGAIVCFLFILGLFIIKGEFRWWILVATILSIFLAWGKNFQWFTDLFFNYFPMYNKFRTVSMSLVIAGFTMPLMGFLALKEIFEGKVEQPELKKSILYSLGITGGITLIILAIPDSIFNIKGIEDDRFAQYLIGGYKIPEAIVNEFMDALNSDRIAYLRADAWRSLAFIVISGGVLYLFTYKKVHKTAIIISLSVLILLDLWSIDKRLLNDDYFVSNRKIENEFTMTPASGIISKDTDPNFRVADISMRADLIFRNSDLSYFHKSIGGYHGAKLRRFQDLIDGPLTSEIITVQRALKDTASKVPLATILEHTNVLNMLNTKYLIDNPNDMPIINWNALGNAWFITNIEMAENADDEYAAISTINPEKTAVIHNEFSEYVKEISKTEFFSLDTGVISLTKYEPDHLVYQSIDKIERLAVFSEMYYESGWNAYIDDNPVEHIRADYFLRALKIPKGKHKIEFKFEPRTYYVAQTISLVSSILVFLILGGLAAKLIIDYRKQNIQVTQESVKQSEKKKTKIKKK